MTSPQKWTIKSILDWTADYLKKFNIEWPHLEGEILLSYALGVKRIELYIQHERVLTDPELAKYKALILRRSKHEPIAYIVGTQPFMSLELEVNPSVLIPRPETEKLVECVLDLAAEVSLSPGQKLKIADLCTGSGAIAVSLAKYLPQAEITATDIADAALTLARRNAEKFNVADRITFLQDDLLNTQLTTYNILVSNPPYIPIAELPKLMPDVRDFEPVSALDGGPDGLKFIHILIEKSPALIKPGGYLVMEIGFDQKEKVLELCRTAVAGRNFKETKVVPDQFGKDRVFVGKVI
ncbi:MAG: peptide chain release factor N(5)-glutamine methyltransferase [Candidatus Margulisiibacteriota bacterium]